MFQMTPLTSLIISLAASLALGACTGGNEEQKATPPPGAKQVAVELKSFAFKPKDLSFAVGDSVFFTFKSKDIEHTFTAKELGIDSYVRGGRSAQKSFVFAKAGEYRVICAIAGHEAAGMVGKIVVQ